MPRFFRTDQAAIHVTVAGVTIDDNVWDTMEGGDRSSDGVNYLPGGMAPSVELGGLPKRSDLTISRIWSDTMIAAYKALDNGCGKAAVTASYTNLDANGTMVPNSTITYTGILKSVTRPNYDSNSSGEAKLTIVVGLNGQLS